MQIIRQCTAKLVSGQPAALGDVSVAQFKWLDVPRRYVLQMAADGKMVQDYVAMATNTSHQLKLPSAYVPGTALAAGGRPLRCAFRSTDVCKLTIVSPDQGTSNILVKGTNGATNGSHDGYLILTGTITSITLAVPSQIAGPVEVEYALYELPDITQSAAFRGGTLTFGTFP